MKQSVDDSIKKISEIASQLTGVQLGDRQRSMVVNRLNRRISELKLTDVDDYYRYLQSNFKVESRYLVSLLTTHHTFFFREFLHFRYIEETALPQMIEIARARPDKTIRIWSAACSRGQEVYSLAMFFHKILKEKAPDLKFTILGSDVDIESVKWAQNGVYNKSEIKEVPLPFLADHWARGTGEIADFVKVKKTLRAYCRFEDRNLLKLPNNGESGHFDLIMCRNVLIYFNADQVKQVAKGLIERLHPKGHLVVGVSESLLGLDLPINNRGPSVYSMKDANPVASVPASSTNVVPMTPAVAQEEKPLRILCVDDSSSILAIMKKILTKENGFEVVGTAMNGFEASEQLKKLTVDAITMDIHMPEQTGVEYLKANMHANHPPVIMISSVSREDGDLAIKALEYGASDYVEKPTLQTFQQKSDEIHMKLRSAVQSFKAGTRGKLSSFDQEFKRPSGTPKGKGEMFLITCGMGEVPKVEQTLKELKKLGWKSPVMILIEGAPGALTKLSGKFETQSGSKVQVLEKDASVAVLPSGVLLGDFHDCFAKLAEIRKSAPLSVFVFGQVSKAAQFQLSSLKNCQILIEDTNPKIWKDSDTLAQNATDKMPWTSFVYMSGEYFLKAG